MGFSEEMVAAFRLCNTGNCAVYLLPYLKPGMRALDFGCGPGTLSAGLAQVVAPGELYGIDTEETQVELAKSLAAALQVENVTFQVGDVTELPFEDDFFDVAHAHDVLFYVPDTRAALAEVMRVLKPGGVYGEQLRQLRGGTFPHVLDNRQQRDIKGKKVISLVRVRLRSTA